MVGTLTREVLSWRTDKPGKLSVEGEAFDWAICLGKARTRSKAKDLNGAKRAAMYWVGGMGYGPYRNYCWEVRT